MTTQDAKWAYRIIGGTHEARVSVHAGTALGKYARCDAEMKLDSEAYLSAFRFGDDAKKQIDATGTLRDYHGPCWSPWLWLDIDRDDRDVATGDAKRLLEFVLERYTDLAGEDLLVFFSGNKGYHFGLPVPDGIGPSDDFNDVAKRLALALAAHAQVRIDEVIYNKTRAFRAPNSRHPKTGLYKRWLTHEQLLSWDADEVVRHARRPVPFTVPTRKHSALMLADWQEAVTRHEQRKRESAGAHRVAGRLTAETQDFLRYGAEEGHRHDRLFRAAANMAELDRDVLIGQVLGGIAADCAMPPAEIRRVIGNAIRHTNTHVNKQVPQ